MSKLPFLNRLNETRNSAYRAITKAIADDVPNVQALKERFVLGLRPQGFSRLVYSRPQCGLRSSGCGLRETRQPFQRDGGRHGVVTGGVGGGVLGVCVSCRAGGVGVDLAGRLDRQTSGAEAGRTSLIVVVDPAQRQLPGPEAVQRALDLLESAARPLIILGKGAAYAQADADIRALIEKTGIPYLPMAMAKGLLPDTHEQSAAAARSYVLPEADVVLRIEARRN